MSDSFERYDIDNTDPRVYYSSSAYTAPAEQTALAKKLRPKRHILRRLVCVFICVAVIAAAVYFILNYRVVISRDDGLNIKIYKGYAETLEKENAGSAPVPTDSGEYSTQNENGYAVTNKVSAANSNRLAFGEKVTLNLSDEEAAAAEETLSLSQIYTKCAPFVVSITGVDSNKHKSCCSGVIMSENGYIITNTGVVADAVSITVAVYGGRDYSADIVGADFISGIAVLKIDGVRLTAAEFGDFDGVEVGESVSAIVNPVNKSFSIVDGIISSPEQTIDYSGYKISVFQTSAQSGSGCSGSPIINSCGQVIGILNSDMTETYLLENLGFALPINTVKPIVDEILAKGYVSGRPTFGMEFIDLPLSVAAYYRLPVGVFVSGVYHNSDAYSRGISRGDIIISVNGESITSSDELDEVKNSLAVGDTVVLGIYRNREVYSVEVALVDLADLQN